MAKRCIICGKGALIGNKIKRRGMAKAKGGAGQKITGITRRKFFPNLQKVKANINGNAKTVIVCSKCIKAGKIQKA